MEGIEKVKDYDQILKFFKLVRQKISLKVKKSFDYYFLNQNSFDYTSMICSLFIQKVKEFQF